MTQTKGIYLDGPTSDARVKITEFLTAAGITPTFVDAEADAAVVIHWPAERMECAAKNIYADGYSTCAAAFQQAAAIGIERGLFGEFLNLLNIKLKQCQFGCF